MIDHLYYLDELLLEVKSLKVTSDKGAFYHVATDTLNGSRKLRKDNVDDPQGFYFSNRVDLLERYIERKEARIGVIQRDKDALQKMLNEHKTKSSPNKNS